MPYYNGPEPGVAGGVGEGPASRHSMIGEISRLRGSGLSFMLELVDRLTGLGIHV